DRAVELSGQLDDPASVALWRMNRAVILLHRPGDRETRLRALADAQAALAYRTPERGLTNHLYARINLGLAYQRTIPDDPANLDRIDVGLGLGQARAALGEWPAAAAAFQAAVDAAERIELARFRADPGRFDRLMLWRFAAYAHARSSTAMRVQGREREADQAL